MRKLKDLAEKLLSGEEVILSEKRFNDGTEEEPDIIIDKILAVVESNRTGNKDIVVYLQKENDDSIYSTNEIYKVPYIRDLEILEKILTLAKKQAHL